MKLIRIALNFCAGAKADQLNKQAAMILKYDITDAITIETQRLHYID